MSQSEIERLKLRLDSVEENMAEFDRFMADEMRQLREMARNFVRLRRRRQREMLAQLQFERDRAIAQQIANEHFHCDICDMDYAIDDIFVIASCHYRVCLADARAHLESQIRDLKYPLTCVHCDAEVTCDEAEMAGLSDELVLLMRKTAFERATADCVQCPQPNCAGKADVVAPHRQFICPVCSLQMCTHCKDQWHAGTCEEWAAEKRKQALLRQEKEADDKFEEWRNATKIQVCPRCKFGVEKNQGCNHMTCRCGAQFCYLCGADWAGHRNCPGQR